MKKVIFKGSGVAIITPFNPDFSVNYPKLGELIDWQIEQGTDCIVICGTTGESSTLTDEEHSECIRYATAHTAGRVPVIAGCGANDTPYAIKLSKDAKAAGVQGLLHVTPYYNKTSQKGLVRHFSDIADSTDLPVVLYNVPGRTGLDIKPQTYLELSKHPNIVATKEANGDIAAAARTIGLCGDALAFYSGNDDFVIPLMSLGGLGVISAAANVIPKKMHTLTQKYFDGDTLEAGRMQAELMGFVDMLFCDVNPIPVKEAMNQMGLEVGPCRLPLVEIEPSGRALVSRQLEKFGLLK